MLKHWFAQGCGSACLFRWATATRGKRGEAWDERSVLKLFSRNTFQILIKYWKKANTAATWGRRGEAWDERSVLKLFYTVCLQQKYFANTDQILGNKRRYTDRNFHAIKGLSRDHRKNWRIQSLGTRKKVCCFFTKCFESSLFLNDVFEYCAKKSRHFL